MNQATAQHNALALDVLRDLASTDPGPDALARLADAIGEMTNNMVPDGQGGMFSMLTALEQMLENSILAARAGDPHALAWKLGRLLDAHGAAEPSQDDWTGRMVRSCLADARALEHRLAHA